MRGQHRRQPPWAPSGRIMISSSWFEASASRRSKVANLLAMTRQRSEPTPPDAALKSYFAIPSMVYTGFLRLCCKTFAPVFAWRQSWKDFPASCDAISGSLFPNVQGVSFFPEVRRVWRVIGQVVLWVCLGFVWKAMSASRERLGVKPKKTNRFRKAMWPPQMKIQKRVPRKPDKYNGSRRFPYIAA